MNKAFPCTRLLRKIFRRGIGKRRELIIIHKKVLIHKNKQKVNFKRNDYGPFPHKSFLKTLFFFFFRVYPYRGGFSKEENY